MIHWIQRHPGTSAVMLLIVLALLFFNRALFPPAGMVLGGHDMVGYYYPYYEAVRTAILEGHLPVWEPDLFGGYPLMAQPQQNAFYPPTWVNLVLPTTTGVSWYMWFHVVLAGVGMLAFVRVLGGDWLPGLLAAVSFSYGGVLVGRLWAGHSTVYAVLAWTPWLLAATGWSVKRERITAAIVAGLPLGMALLAGHIPSILYVGLIWAAFVVYLLITETNRRMLVLRQATVMGVIGLGLAAVQLAPFVQFSLHSGRVATADYAFATDYSLPPAHLITLLLPEFFGEPLRLGYWSVPTFEELTYYAGLLAVLGIFLALRRPTRVSLFFLILIFFGLWLAMGRYSVLYELAYRFLPPFQIVRAPGRAAFLFLFSATALLGYELSRWRTMGQPKNRQNLWPYFPIVVMVLGLAGFAALAATGAVFATVHPTDTSGRLWHQIGGYAVALIILTAGAALLWAFLQQDDPTPSDKTGLFQRPGWRLVAISAALVTLVVFDTWFFSFKMVRLEPAEPEAVWVDAKAIIGEPSAGRVLPWGISLFSQNGAMQVGLPSVFGYDSLEPAAHINLASSVPDPRSTAYDILGVRYVIAGTELEDYADGDSPLRLIGQQGAAWVYERERPLPISRLVYSLEVIPDGAEAITRIHSPDFNAAEIAILNATAPCVIGSSTGGQGSAEVVAHEPTYWRIETSSDQPALHILAENAYPGWEVKVDGHPAEALTAYTSIRAVCVDAGDHLIEWTFRPLAIWIGGAISLVTLILLAIATWVEWKAELVRKVDDATASA